MPALNHHVQAGNIMRCTGASLLALAASEEYNSRGPAAPEYLAPLEAAAETGLLDLSVLQTASYVEALGRAIQAAIAGGDPKQALDQAAAEWDALAEQIGVAGQRAAYLDWAAKPNAYAP